VTLGCFGVKAMRDVCGLESLNPLWVVIDADPLNEVRRYHSGSEAIYRICFSTSGASISMLSLSAKPAPVQTRKTVVVGQADLQDAEVALQPLLLIDDQVQVT